MHGTVHLFDSLPEVRLAPAPLDRALAFTRQVPLVGVIRNRRSHRNGGGVPDWAGRANVLIEIPERRSELADILARFAERGVDYLVVDGGDGTVRDVLTSGAGVFGESWPPIIVLPNGKTNALATDLGVPAKWSLADALEAIAAGQVVVRRPLVVARRENPVAQVQGFVFGAGAYTEAIGLGQDAHDRGAFNALGVAVTAVWSLAQAMFGSNDNVWRRGTAMRLYDSSGRELPHCGEGRADERYLIFASTLDRFPAGLRPFGTVDGPLRAAVIDNAQFGVLARMPLIFRGMITQGLRRRGYHVLGSDAIDLDIGGRFILDGEAFPAGRYRLSLGPKLRFVVP
jgi:diacylglycerol kinase (ATP)